MAAPPITRWRRAVQYRWTCAQCGEVHQCAVIRRSLRLCQSCYLDGFWRKPAGK
jgi:hypothetical protein